MAKYRASICVKVEEGENEARIMFEFEEFWLSRIMDAYEAFSITGNKDMDLYIHKVEE